jgi:hypothetical protein
MDDPQPNLIDSSWLRHLNVVPVPACFAFMGLLLIIGCYFLFIHDDGRTQFPWQKETQWPWQKETQWPWQKKKQTRWPWQKEEGGGFKWPRLS